MKPSTLSIDKTGIKNYLFDLGNVLLDIDIARANRQFSAIGFENLLSNFYTPGQEKIFDLYEAGHITTDEFIESIQKLSSRTISSDEIIDAWNQIIGEYRKSSFDFLLELKKTSNIYLLSNTNECHHRFFSRTFLDLGIGPFDTFFNQVFYSFEMGCRKPDEDIYSLALNAAGLKAEETLFVDDLKINTDAASRLGIQTLHLTSGMNVEEVLAF